MSREKKKRHGLLVGLTALIWLMIGAMIYGVDPEVVRDILIPGTYLVMGLLLFLGFFLLLSIIFLSAKRGLIWTSGIMVFLYLRIYGLGSVLNAALVLGILLSTEIYSRLTKRDPSATLSVTKS